MQTSVQSSSLSDVDDVISYARKVVHPYKCDWKACDALLNCWENLQKHYHSHCKRSNTMQDRPSGCCGLYPCATESHRALTLHELMTHVDKTHLSRVHLPCPLNGCEDSKPIEQFETHIEMDHMEFFNKPTPTTQYSLQAFPFRPARPSRVPLPQGTIPMHVVLSSTLTIFPSRQAKLRPIASQEHLTSWSSFEFAEHIERDEERSMTALDLGFEPLGRPPHLSDLSGTSPWPEFSICAQKFSEKQFTQVSQPFPLSASGPLDHAQTILYDAFEQWLKSRA